MSCWSKTRVAATWTAAALLVTGGTPSCAAPRKPMPNPPRDARELFDLDEPLSEDVPRFVPLVVAPQLTPGSPSTGGTPLATLNGRDVAVKDVLLSLFQDSDLNVLIDSDVLGTASFDIKATTTEEAFTALLRYLDLSYEVEGDFVRIGTRARRTINLDLLNSEGGGNSGGGSIWGQIEADLDRLGQDGDMFVISPLSGSIEVEAPPSRVARVESYLDNLLDRARRQVSLEVRIIEVRLNDEYKLGVDLSVFDTWLSSDLTGTLGGGSIADVTTKSGGDAFSIGFINPGRFELFIDALESQGQVRVLSSPRVSTMNNVAANIRVTDQIPVIEREVIDTEAGSRTEFDIRFVDAGIFLDILPQVGDDRFITLWTNPRIVEQTGTVTTPDGLQEEPILSTRETTTTIRVADGEAIVLGGLRSTAKGETLSEVPLLSDIPGLGHLFRSTAQSASEVELIVMVTPRVIDDAWRQEELRRAFHRALALRRPFMPSTIGLNDRPVEPWDLGRLSGELPARDLRLMQATSFDEPAVLPALPTATVTRGGLADTLFGRAVEAAAAGRFDLAVDRFEQVLALQPDRLDAALYAGLIELERDRLEPATRYLDRVLMRRSDDAMALSLRGIVALRQGAFSSAVGFLDQAHRLTGDADSASNLAAAQIFAGREDAARALLESVEERHDAPAGAHLNLAYLYLKAGDADRGEEQMVRALERGAAAGDQRLTALRHMLDQLRG